MNLVGWTAVLCLALGLAGCSDKAAPPTAPSADKPSVTGNLLTFPVDSPQLASLKTSPVTQKENSAVELTGRLVWDENRSVRVFPPLAGRVARIFVESGTQVQVGQALVSLASPDFGQAQADAGRAVADSALAEKNLARIRELHEHGVAPRKDLVQAEADHARSQSELARAQGRVRMYGGGSSVDQTLTLKSPIAGTVVERNVNPGQELRPDQSGTPALFVITDPTRLWVQIDAHESDLAVLSKGAAFGIRVPTYPGETFAAQLDSIADFVDPQTRVVKARGSIANADRRLKGEMLVTAVFEAKGPRGVEVPSRSVIFTEGTYYAFIERGKGSYERARVVPGPERGGRLTIASGLAAGQVVVSEGALLLQQVFRGGNSKTESE